MLTAKVGSTPLAAYTYGPNNGPLTRLTYGNGSTVDYTYDNLGRVKTSATSGGKNVSYFYNGEGQLYKTTTGDWIREYVYDTLGRPVSASVIVDGAEKLQLQNEYNANNQLIKQFRLLPDKTITTTFAYDDNGRLTTYNSGTGDSSTLIYDSLNRLSTVTDHTNQRTYSYADGAEENTTTTRVSQVTYTGAGSGTGFTPLTYTYTYDSRGNILTISDPISGNRSYEYDALGQMTKETIGGTTYTYTYDTVGNLTSYNGVTLSYTDSVWQDRLTEVTINLQIFDPEDGPISYNGGLLDGDIIGEGELIHIGGVQVYDEVGNPTTYANTAGRWNFTWDGRELKTAVPQGIGSSVSYTYDENGLRTTKTVGDTTHTYFYAADGTLIRETRSNGDTMEFLYDHAGQPYALILNGTVYYYVVNLQGDVVRIVDESGNTVVSYVYNAWGKSLSVTTNIPNTGIATAAFSNATIVAKMNPLRYRGYYYDTETGFYYLQSRYYDPAIGRFINADSYSSTGQGILDNNMYAYCRNNPVNMVDVSGDFPEWIEDGINWFNENVVEPLAQLIENVKEDADAFDIDNKSEEKVLKSNYFSSYKGVPVFRTNGIRSGSFGVIFITRETNQRKDAEDIVRHEYGHTVQFRELGVLNYTMCIMIPSWQMWGSKEYYTKPWEITADLYGRVQSRNHAESDFMYGFAYLDASKHLGPLIWLSIE